MKIYQNLFAYLNDDCLLAENTVLHGCDRPILVTESDVNNSVSIEHSRGVYEIGFPYLKPADLKQHDARCQTELKIEINEIEHSLFVTDEVLDKDSIEDETELEKWLERLPERQLDTSISLLLQNFNSLFSDRGNIAEINLHYLPEYLSNFDVAEANLPLVISLEKQYELSRKLRTIIPKLRYQLRRKAQLMSISRIQEMDSYCLQDYIRRPGRSPEEKAGAKQQLMGIKREQNYNTLENKFLVYFAARLLHLECFRYESTQAQEYRELVQKLRRTIDLFKRSPLIQNISVRHFKLTKPNYVLLQNPIYNSFYRAYQDYVYKRSQKKHLWSYRTNLLGDTVYLCLNAAILRFQGVNVKPTSIKIRTSADYGNYILGDNQPVSIPVFLEDFVYEFKLSKNSDKKQGDYSLHIELHDLKSNEFHTNIQIFPIWIFWYKPSEDIINSANNYLKNNVRNYSRGILFYLQLSPDITKSFVEEERELEAELDSEMMLGNAEGKLTCPTTVLKAKSSNILLYQFPNPLNSKNFNSIVYLLAKEIIKPLAEVVR